MAINLPGASNGRIALPGVNTPAGLTELSILGTINISSLATNERIIGQWGSIGRSFLTTITDTDEVGFVVASNDSNLFGVKTTVTNLSTGLARFSFRWRAQTGADDMQIAINSVLQTTTSWFSSEVAALQSVTDDIEIGHETESVLDGVEGDYAEFAIYGEYLPDWIFYAYGKGFSPRFYPNNRLHYLPLHNVTTLIDEDGNSSPTNSSGTTSQHPAMFYPVPGRIGKAASASAHTGTASLSLQPISMSASGHMVPEAIAALNIGQVSLTASGQQPHEGVADLTMQPLVLDASGHMVPESVAALNIATPALVAEGTFDTGAYTINAVEFDGTNDDLTRGADLTGNADSKLVTFSFWFNTSGNGIFIDTTSNAFQVQIFNGTIFVRGENASNTVILTVEANAGYADGSWHHCMGSFDMSNAANRHLYVDDASDLTVTTYTDDTIDFTKAEHSIGAQVNGVTKLTGCLADVWADYGTYIDLSVEANRRKFVGAGAASVVDLGSDGSTPTGTAPLIFLSGATASWHTNKGTGGGFTENGALTDCATVPPAVVSGAGVISLQSPVLTASGEQPHEGVAALSIATPELVASGTMAQAPSGTANLVIQPIGLQAAGTGPASGFQLSNWLRRAAGRLMR